MNINLSTFAKGALAEKLNNSIMEVLTNIQDPNTSENKARKVTLTLTFKPYSERELVAVKVDTKTTLCQPEAAETKLVVGYNSDGKLMASEYKNIINGQVEMSIPEEEVTPEEVQEETNSDTVIDLRKKAANK